MQGSYSRSILLTLLTQSQGEAVAGRGQLIFMLT